MCLMFDSTPKIRGQVLDSKKINTFNISGFLVILFEDNAPINRLQASVTLERHIVARLIRERDVPYLAPCGYACKRFEQDERHHVPRIISMISHSGISSICSLV